jgi:hypothetical protein
MHFLVCCLLSLVISSGIVDDYDQIGKLRPTDRTQEIKEVIKNMAVEKVYLYTVRILSQESDLKSLHLASIGLDRLVSQESKNLNGTDFEIILERVKTVYSSLLTRSDTIDYQIMAQTLNSIIVKIEKLLSSGDLRQRSTIEFGQILYEYENQDVLPKNPRNFYNILQILANYNYKEFPGYPEQKEKIKEWLEPMEEYFFSLIVEIKEFDDQVQLEKAIRRAIPNLKDSRKLQMYMHIKLHMANFRAASVALILMVTNSTQTKEEFFRSYCYGIASLLQRLLEDEDPLRAQLNAEISKKFAKNKMSMAEAFHAAENSHDLLFHIWSNIMYIGNPYSVLYEELSKPEYDYFTTGVNKVRQYLASYLDITN